MSDQKAYKIAVYFTGERSYTVKADTSPEAVEIAVARAQRAGLDVTGTVRIERVSEVSHEE